MAKLENETKVIAGFLASALDIEDNMSKEVYSEFLDRGSWPKQLSDDCFQEIKSLLDILIKDTEEHKKMFLNLKNQSNE